MVSQLPHYAAGILGSHDCDGGHSGDRGDQSDGCDHGDDHGNWSSEPCLPSAQHVPPACA